MKLINVSISYGVTSLTASNYNVCENSSSPVILTCGIQSGPGGQIKWYTDSIGGSPFATSSSGIGIVVTPTQTTTYYAEAHTTPIIETFSYTGAAQAFIVPDSVYTLTIDAQGAGGDPAGGARDEGGGAEHAEVPVGEQRHALRGLI
mgnify:CR=1 FL=1